MFKSKYPLSNDFVKEKNIKNILLIKLSSIGDVIHISPVIREIKKNNPAINISLITEESAWPLIELNSHLTQKFLFQRISWEKKLKKNPLLIFSFIIYCIKLIKIINKTNWDLTIDLQGLERSVFFLYFVKSRFKVAWGRWLGFTMRYLDNKKTYALEKYLKCVCQLKLINKNQVKNQQPEIFINDQDKIKVDKFLIKNQLVSKKYALINPLSRWITKNLSSETILKIIDISHKSNMPPILIGTEDVKPYEKILTEKGTNFLSATALFNLRELYYMISKASVLFTVDSASMHLGSACQTPTLAFFGPTKPLLTGPYGKAVVVIKNLQCSNCLKRKCSNFICMDFTVNEIESGFKKLLT